MVKFGSKVWSLAFVSAMLVNCGSSAKHGEGGETQSASKAPEKSNNTSDTPEQKSSSPTTSEADAPSVASTGGPAFEAVDGVQDAAASAEEAPVGCALPENIASVLSAKGQLLNTEAGSWSNSGGDQKVASAKVGNLDLATCPWYRQAKAQGGSYYMITYVDKGTGQTHAQLSTSVNAIAFAICITESTAVGASCAFMP